MPCSLIDRHQAMGGTPFLRQDSALKTEIAAVCKNLILNKLQDVTSQETVIFIEPH